jgi:AcrR family transcriptional regulator
LGKRKKEATVEVPSEGRTKDVPTQIKDPDLVKERRQQIVDASVKLFIKNGFHKTTTRQIANATGFSIGSLYEYVASKEDVLYLVCDSIHAEVEESVGKILSRETPGRRALTEIIREFFLICDRLSDHVLLMYQVTQFLPPQWKKKVLENEIRITGIFVDVFSRINSSDDLPRLDKKTIDLVAHNISVIGQSWAFRRWYYTRHYSINEFINFQTKTIFGLLEGKRKVLPG